MWKAGVPSLMRRTEYYEKTVVFYIADLSKRCIHIVDALLHWDHNAVALFTFREFEKEAAERGFRLIHKADYACMKMMHVQLIRKQTLGFANCCDYMMVGDKDPLVKEHPQYHADIGYIRNK